MKETRRLAAGKFNMLLFPVGVGLSALACYLYCALLWTPRSMSWTDPDSSILCWLFCFSLSGTRKAGIMLFGGATFFMASASLFSAWALARGRRWGKHLLICSGLFLFPLGILNFLPLCLKKRKEQGNGP